MDLIKFWILMILVRTTLGTSKEKKIIKFHYLQQVSILNISIYSYLPNNATEIKNIQVLKSNYILQVFYHLSTPVQRLGFQGKR